MAKKVVERPNQGKGAKTGFERAVATEARQKRPASELAGVLATYFANLRDVLADPKIDPLIRANLQQRVHIAWTAAFDKDGGEAHATLEAVEMGAATLANGIPGNPNSTEGERRGSALAVATLTLRGHCPQFTIDPDLLLQAIEAWKPHGRGKWKAIAALLGGTWNEESLRVEWSKRRAMARSRR